MYLLMTGVYGYTYNNKPLCYSSQRHSMTFEYKFSSVTVCLLRSIVVFVVRNFHYRVSGTI